MNRTGRAQHIADQLSSDATGIVDVSAVEVDRLDSGLLDEFEPASGLGGYDPRSTAILFSSSFLEESNDSVLQLAIMHALGCARFRRRPLRRLCDAVGGAMPAVWSSFGSVGMVAMPVPFPALPYGAPLFGPEKSAGKLTARQAALHAGDKYCWQRSNSEERDLMIGLIQERDCVWAHDRVQALTSPRDNS